MKQNQMKLNKLFDKTTKLHEQLNNANSQQISHLDDKQNARNYALADSKAKQNKSIKEVQLQAEQCRELLAEQSRAMLELYKPPIDRYREESALLAKRAEEIFVSPNYRAQQADENECYDNIKSTCLNMYNTLKQSVAQYPIASSIAVGACMGAMAALTYKVD